MSTDAVKKGRRWAVALLLLVLMAGAGLRWRGIEWPLLHPDEYKISSWATWIETHDKTFDVAYPSGYFHLVKPLLLVKNAFRDGEAGWQCFKGHGDVMGPPALDVGQPFVLRKINAGFALVTVWLFYLMAWRITRSRWAAVVAAAFLAFSRLHVEHSHYAETDIAMVFTFSLALYAWIRVCESARVGWLWAAAFFSGLALGTKYTNAILLPGAVAGLVIWARNGLDTRRHGRWVWVPLATIAFLGAGILYANRHIMDAEFWPAIHHASQNAIGEQAGLLGKSVSDPMAAFRSNWNMFKEGLTELGWIWGLFIVAGLGCSLMPRYRRFWPVTLLPAGVYLAYFLKLAPWVRGQEFMLFLPLLAMFIAMAVAAIAERGRIMAAGAAILVLAAVFQNGVSAMRFTSLCAYPEPRIQAMQWLYTHAPLDARIGIEEYTVPPCRLFGSCENIRQVEWMDPGNIAKSKLGYLLRNETSTGRGSVDPKTNELYPDYAANLTGFKKEARLLCQWGPQASLYSFVGNRIEWWDTHLSTSTTNLALPVFRPTLIDYTDYVEIPMTDSGVGSLAGMFVDTAPRSFVVSGAGAVRRRLYVVLQTEERGGEITVNGMGDRHTVKLGPYDVAAVAVERPWFLPRTSDYDVISIRARERNHFQYLPCYAHVVTTPREAALLLFQKGYFDQALAWLAIAPEERDDWIRYVCAVETKDWAQADRLVESARRSLVQFEALQSLSPKHVTINGCGGVAYRDHARIRIPGLDTGREGISMVVPHQPVMLVKDPEARQFEGEFTVPVRLAPGHYTMHGSIENASGMVVHQPWAVTVRDSVSGVTNPLTIVFGQTVEFSSRLTVSRSTGLTLTFVSSQMGGELGLSDIEIRWNEEDWFPAEREQLRRALARHEGARLSPRPGPVFYPWLKLTGADMTSGGVCRLQIEVQKNSPPPLKMVVYRRKKLGWGAGKIHEVTLEGRGREADETVTVDVPVPVGTKLSDLGIRVFPDGEWISDPLRATGTDDGRVWLK